ncbi:MAG: fibronectin type III domain-containing protein, partial [Chloroflexota bacterium]
MLSMLPAVLVAVALAYAFMSPQSASAAPPDEPQNVTATAGNGEIELSWDEPDDDGGETITQYDAECVAGGHTRTSSATPPTTSTTVDGVQNGATYECTVTATNADGTGDESDPVEATPSDVPLPPQNISGIPGDELIIVD